MAFGFGSAWTGPPSRTVKLVVIVVVVQQYQVFRIKEGFQQGIRVGNGTGLSKVHEIVGKEKGKWTRIAGGGRRPQEEQAAILSEIALMFIENLFDFIGSWIQ